jgi:hypothetical protein
MEDELNQVVNLSGAAAASISLKPVLYHIIKIFLLGID